MAAQQRGGREPATEFIVFIPDASQAGSAGRTRLQSAVAARFPRFSFLYRWGNTIGDDDDAITVIPIVGSAGGASSSLRAHPGRDILAEIADEVRAIMRMPLH